MPWQAGFALGFIAYGGIRYGIGWLLSSSQSPFLAAFGKQGLAGAYAPIAWFVLFACWLAALVSYFRQRHRRRLLETQTGLDSIRVMNWKEFELLVGEAFRRQGYAVEETGLGGADGGVDLILRKDGEMTLVQCKQWRTRQVPVNVVRETFGLLAHHKAKAVKIVTAGDYTADARRFAQSKPIELIHGDALLNLIRVAQTAETKTPLNAAKSASFASRLPVEETAAPPVCPKCGSAMIQRENRRSKQRFWGCISYPSCRGTRIA
jgi:restriction system protein